MKVLTVDVSASSLRVLKIGFLDGKFSLETVYREPNDLVEKDGHYYWDNEKIAEGVIAGIKKAVEEDPDISSIGIDTWGVDYVPLDKKNAPISMARAYRDSRCEDSCQTFLKEHSYRDVYMETGIQRCNFNTIFQLYDDSLLHPTGLHSFLLMPDYLVYRLTGKKVTEVTNLSTGALYDPRIKKIAEPCLKMSNYKSDIAPLVFPGEVIGKTKIEGMKEIPVIAVCSHDTASAIASMPLSDNSFYISSGTWSLLGAELDEPKIDEESFEADFTNEVGYEGRICYLKNIMGFFIIQQLRAEFGNPAYADIQSAALASKIQNVYIDVDQKEFAAPGNMKAKIDAYLAKTEQKTGELTLGDYAKIVYESLAVAYARRIADLEKLLHKKADRLVVTGGGTAIPSLLQNIANLSGLEVVTGEPEATSYGNALVQLIALGQFASLEEARFALRNSGASTTYKPEPTDNKIAFETYASIMR